MMIDPHIRRILSAQTVVLAQLQLLCTALSSVLLFHATGPLTRVPDLAGDTTRREPLGRLLKLN